MYLKSCGQGVYCDLHRDGLWYVGAINIGPVYDNSLKCTSTDAAFSHSLFNLKHLKALSFFNCFTSPHQNPVTISSLNWTKFTNSLESLEFRSNSGLIGTIPNTIGSLKKLRSLVILENGLSGILPMEMGNLANLKKLVLAGNHFAGQIPSSFGFLNELLILDSSRNNLSGSLPWSFGALSSLLKLDLNTNMLGGSLPSELGRLKNLTLLDLGSNKFSGGSLAQSLQEMVSLREMVVSNNPIGGDLMSIHWEKLQNLEILDLSNTALTGNIPESMAGLKRLRYLNLENNNLSGSVPPKFGSLPNVSTLYINGNDLTGELGFSEWFYRKLGGRFGAWENPNLCYRAELASAPYVPYGVKPCKQVTSSGFNGVSIAKTSEENWNGSSQYVKSLGFASLVGFREVVAVQASLFVVFLSWNVLF